MTWGRAPETGDWVTTTTVVTLGVTDALTGGGLARNTRGVVVGRQGRMLDVEFDTGLGSCRARVPRADVRRIRRAGGRYTFHRRSRRMAVARLAVAGFLLFPIVQWAVAYLHAYRTTDGLVPAFILAAVESFGELLAIAVQHPAQTLLYAAFLTLLSRFAFRH